MESDTENENEIVLEYHKDLNCSKCQKPFYNERVVKIDNLYFHMDHFKCIVCSRNITDKFLFYENHFWCKSCSKSAKRMCHHCNKKIEADYCLFANHHFYHDGHFCCSICQRKIINSKESSKKYGIINNENSKENICCDCLTKIASNACSRCGVLIQNSEEYVKSRNSLWHIGCFICSICSISLLQRSQYCEYDGLLYCILHIPKNVETIIINDGDNKADTNSNNDDNDNNDYNNNDDNKNNE
ncbi:hypothetical protein BCR32DRAFT_297174 [Anaeromyces robustus]|uniref:LIM zinc-binding domain-containing protein n=1 Tax=Anaeromyces robustus TaxID=1754192 RepID=A0A1Y1WJ02_9FUNG|nr:hypothetical protein BCR32DRAFT_297174 [Anaeromyces robustus]|eukprot:ORX73473.1 hypothetical protein BCR32DRAFT_297174 [Anaeromyces robustus]